MTAFCENTYNQTLSLTYGLSTQEDEVVVPETPTEEDPSVVEEVVKDELLEEDKFPAWTLPVIPEIARD